MTTFPFTFYGDLLGVGSAYRLGSDIAYEKLNAFYNETFSTLSVLSQQSGTEVQMFNDSLFILGDDAYSAVQDIGNLYSNLLRKGLLLRGAIVSKKLTYDVCVTRHNFQKQLPKDDTLARAAGLEKLEAGARFIIEPALANSLLGETPLWKTNEGYSQSKDSYTNDVLRRICPTPTNSAYEYLFYWTVGIEPQEYAHRIEQLKQVIPMIDDRAKEHYRATIELIRRCEHRHKITK